jgi:hypothetical protein
MSNKLDLPYIYASEQIELNNYYLQQATPLTPITTTGQVTFVSLSSNVVYSTVTSCSGAYSNLGGSGMMQVLQATLLQYLITAEDFNAKLDQSGSTNYGVDTTNTVQYVINLTPAPTALTAGMSVYFTVTNTNTGGATLNVNSLGSHTMTKNGSFPLIARDLTPGFLVHAVYDGTNWQVTPSSMAGGTFADSIGSNGSITAALGFINLGAVYAYHWIGTVSGSVTNSGNNQKVITINHGLTYPPIITTSGPVGAINLTFSSTIPGVTNVWNSGTTDFLLGTIYFW